MGRARATVTPLAVAIVVAACGGGGTNGSSAPAGPERSDRPAVPPAGWRTVRNRSAGFTVSVPRTWTAATRRAATLLRSDDRLVALSLSADRSRPGRDSQPAAYALGTLRQIPGFDGHPGRVRRVRGSRYPAVQVTGTGRVRGSRARQRVTVASLRRRGFVTFTVIAFRNARVRPRFNDAVIERIVRSLRGQAPRVTP